jgi:hypothetical protein
VARSLALALIACAAGACEPSFKGTGSLTLDGSPFVPTACHRSSCGTGIVLSDAAGASLELKLPAQVLDAWREVSGPPEVSVQSSASKTTTELRSCGTLTLRGEGYHDGRGRAASGRLSLTCDSPLAVKGEYEFSGCL